MSDCGSGSFWFEPRYLPLMWNISTKSMVCSNLTKLNLLIKILTCINSNLIWPTVLINSLTKFLTLTKITLLPMQYKNFVATNKLLFRPPYNLKPMGLRKHRRKYTVKNLEEYKNLFTLFTNVNTLLPGAQLIPHFSFIALYHFNKQSNVGYFNFKKVFNVWMTLLSFLLNLFFYNIEYLFFSSSYFKYENLALNWSINKNLKQIWRYTNPFLFFLNNKTTLQNNNYFYLLKKKHFNVAVVVDLYYHKRTLHYLNRYKFLTLGPVPLSSNFYSLNITFPVSANSLFSNLFFIRLLFKLRKNASYSKLSGLSQPF